MTPSYQGLVSGILFTQADKLSLLQKVVLRIMLVLHLQQCIKCEYSHSFFFFKTVSFRTWPEQLLAVIENFFCQGDSYIILIIQVFEL